MKGGEENQKYLV